MLAAQCPNWFLGSVPKLHTQSLLDSFTNAHTTTPTHTIATPVSPLLSQSNSARARTDAWYDLGSPPGGPRWWLPDALVQRQVLRGCLRAHGFDADVVFAGASVLWIGMVLFIAPRAHAQTARFRHHKICIANNRGGTSVAAKGCCFLPPIIK